jgi:hypothetical protein
MDIMKQTDQQDGKKNEQKNKNAEHAQFGHKKQMGNGFYERLISEFMNSTKLMQQAFRRISHEWHVFYIFDLALQAERYILLIKCMTDIMRKAIIEKKQK